MSNANFSKCNRCVFLCQHKLGCEWCNYVTLLEPKGVLARYKSIARVCYDHDGAGFLKVKHLSGVKMMLEHSILDGVGRCLVFYAGLS